ncbi:MAG: type III pantothenate kinase [Bacteroidia bacterium]|nr:type III pantothenate kinase [Bacteroidia bacterium]
MANLIIDRGNTFTKWAVFEDGQLKRQGRTESPNLEDLLLDLSPFQTSEAILVSSVKKPWLELDEWVKQAPVWIHFSHLTQTPLVNTYSTPQTLGLDRLAGTVGAWSLFPNQNSLVIDMGTCIKFDFVDRDGRYLGGNISPGMTMRFQALNRYTDQLPLLGFKDFNAIYGNSTESAIVLGVVQGIEQEILGTISLFEKQFGKINTVLTGGDSTIFEKRLKVPIFASPNLVLQGLNAILDYNAGNKQGIA